MRRSRLCVAASSSTSSAMSSSRSAPARGPRPRGRSFCERPHSPDQWGTGGMLTNAAVGGRTMRADSYENHRTPAGNAVMRPSPDSGFWFRSNRGTPPFPPPYYGRSLTQGSWCQPPRAQGPQNPPLHGPPPRNSFQPLPREPRPPPPRQSRLPEYIRRWVSCSRQPPPPHCERFRVVSYNILADYLAWDHRSKLYFHIPKELLDWEWRKSRLLFEFGLWSPDIICLQEVDKFEDLEKELAQYGYDGIWKMRTGHAVDGCAMFWRTNRFVLRHEEHIEFNKLGLRDNVAQICVLESINQKSDNNGSEVSSSRLHPSVKADQIVVCNIHVLYNPKRGDIKLGQVRVLLDRAYSVSKSWNGASIIICGDFNSTPKSPLYNFIAEQKLNLSGLARNEVSGQYSPIYSSQPFYGSALNRVQFSSKNINEKIPQVKSNSHQSEVKDQIALNKEGKTILAESSSYFYISDEVCEHSQLGNPRGEFGPTLGEEDNGHGTLPLLSEVEHVSSVHRSEIKHVSSVHMTCSFSTMQDNDLKKKETMFQDCSPPENGAESNLESATEPTKFPKNFELKLVSDDISQHAISDTSNSQVGSPALASSVGSPLHETSDVSTNLKANQEKVDLDVHAQDFNESKSLNSSNLLDTHPHLDEFDFSINAAQEMTKTTSSGSHHLVADVHEKSPGFTNLGSASGSNASCQNKGHAVSSTGTDYEANSCTSADEDVVSDSSFLEELHGTVKTSMLGGTVSFTALSSQSMSNNGLGEIDFGSLDFEISDQVQEKAYDPLLWTPEEIEAASGNADSTVLEHNLVLTSAYTEAKDYSGTKDSNGEPQVTSYNRQFMGTVDYIWRSESLQTMRVLDTIPKHILQQTPGFPTKKWGSDHLALGCEFSFTKD